MVPGAGSSVYVASGRLFSPGAQTPAQTSVYVASGRSVTLLSPAGFPVSFH